MQIILENDVLLKVTCVDLYMAVLLSLLEKMCP